MDATELRALQAPLKEKYRQDPSAARYVLRARGEVHLGRVGCEVERRPTTLAGLHHAEGDLDFRGTFGVDRDTPVGFTAIRVAFDLVTGAPEDKVAKLLQLTERYCVVFQTLKVAPSLSSTVRRG